jgi:phosphatidylethanolamine N-methyltransferase
MEQLQQLKTLVGPYINLDDPILHLALAAITFNPVFWNIAARLEYKTHILTRIFCGSAKIGCYFLAIVIFGLAIVRDWISHLAMENQPKYPIDDQIALYGSYALIGIGLLLSLGSFFRLGITGTYLGDYFGILMKERVTGFPFNVTDDPMYNGGSLLFLGYALREKSPAGLLLTVHIFLCYQIAAKFFEGPFTSYIYSQAAS